MLAGGVGVLAGVVGVPVGVPGVPAGAVGVPFEVTGVPSQESIVVVGPFGEQIVVGVAGVPAGVVGEGIVVVGPFGVQIVVAVDLAVAEVHFVEHTVAWVLVGERTVGVGLVGAVLCFVVRTGVGQRPGKYKEQV